MKQFSIVFLALFFLLSCGKKSPRHSGRNANPHSTKPPITSAQSPENQAITARISALESDLASKGCQFSEENGSNQSTFELIQHKIDCSQHKFEHIYYILDHLNKYSQTLSQQIPNLQPNSKEMRRAEARFKLATTLCEMSADILSARDLGEKIIVHETELKSLGWPSHLEIQALSSQELKAITDSFMDQNGKQRQKREAVLTSVKSMCEFGNDYIQEQKKKKASFKLYSALALRLSHACESLKIILGAQ